MSKNFSLFEIEQAIQAKNEKKETRPINFGAAKKFSVLMPPPNVTGKLHLGHALNAYIQDTQVLRKQQQGYEVIWVPGFDHAGIATEMMVKNWVEDHHLPLTKTKTLSGYFKQWTKYHREKITMQWKKMGLSLNYELESFTYDEHFQKHVKKAFVTLFDQGLIYRAEKLINWDPKLKTAISNLEIEHIEKNGKLYFVKYAGVNNKKKLTVGTTRPETIFSDQAILVNPKDDNYKTWIGEMVINPLTGAEIPVIADENINMEFGTGAVKCTPGHDFFDFEAGKRHGLKVVENLDESGKIISNIAEFNGLDRYKARKLIVEKLTKKGVITKEQQHIHSVPTSQRSGVVIEPRLTFQWFLKTKEWATELAKKKKQINFFPRKYEKTLWIWLEKIEDWCISRQLTWGHKIPMYQNLKTNEYKAFEEAPDAMLWKASDDILDTWFSSGLWSLVNFPWNENEKLAEFLPIDLLATSYDIIFFWVARMLFFHNHFEKQIPFKQILIHGLVRTENNQKMSKTKGNVVNPEDLIDIYGSDALRFYLLSNHKIGEDLVYSEMKLKQSNQFIYKLWNMNKFVQQNFVINKDFNPSSMKHDCNNWILGEFASLKKSVDYFFEKNLVAFALQKLEIFTTKQISNFYFRIAWTYFQNDDIETKEFIGWFWAQYLDFIKPYFPHLSQHLGADFTDFEIVSLNEIKQFKSALVEKIQWVIDGPVEFKEVVLKVQDIDLWEDKLDLMNEMLKPFGKKITRLVSPSRY